MPDRFWVGGTATWDATAGTKWAATSGGAGGQTVPTANDDVYFDAASGAVIVTTGANVAARNLSFTGFTGTFAGTNTVTVAGSLTLGAGMTRTFTGNIALNSALTTNTITSNGIVLASQITFLGGGKWTLQDALSTPTGLAILTIGTLDLNNQLLTARAFDSNNNNVRAVNFGTQGMDLQGSNQGMYVVGDLTNMTYSGTQRVTLSAAASSGTRIFYNGNTAGGTEAKAVSVRVSAGSDTFTIANSATNSINDLDFTGFTGTFTSGSRTVYGSLTLGAGMTIAANTGATVFGSTSGTKTITSNGVAFDGPLTFNGVGGTWQFADALTTGSTRAVTLTNGTVRLKDGVTSTVGGFVTSGTAQKFLSSTVDGSQATLSRVSGTVNARNVTIKDIRATGGATWNAFTNEGSVDDGNNDGWNFLAITRPVLRRVFTRVFQPIIP